MLIRPLTLIAAVACAFGAQAPAPPALRLPDTVAPIRQMVDLTVVPSAEGFHGSTDIEINVRRPVPVIWLNASELSIENASFSSAAGRVKARVIPGGADFVGLAFDQPSAGGKGTLHLAFKGKLNTQSSSGLFKNKIGEDWYAFTQFESIDARRAFPCFDEPAFKIPWQVTLHVKREHMALNNTPQVSESEEADGMKAVRFAETRPLPSYLLAMAVGPFEAVEAGTAGAQHVPLRIITPRGMRSQAKYAAEVTPQILTALENYFGIPYPYTKLDSIAVPLFFGAMENPGLITYGQTMILSDPARDTAGRQRDYASVAAHEMAHIWFGDLVTTSWWDDIWLNEAFATWMAGRTLQTWKPEWHEDVNGAIERQDAMVTDSKLSARRIRQPANSKDDIANAFDNITYGKGAAVIYMFEQWLSPETFRKGVQGYLKKHADGNATAADFLAALSAAAGRDIAPSFSTFLDQAGVPLLTAELKCGAGKTPVVAVSQRRALPLGSKPPAPQVWQIPVCLRYEGGTGGACTLVTQAKAEIPLPEAKSCPAWVNLNSGQAGYYRTLYRGGLLKSLLAGHGEHLNATERVGVLGDIEALMRSGDIPAAEALAAVPEFAGDSTRQVVTSTISIVQSVGFQLMPEELRPNFQRFIRKVYGARARELGWSSKPGESDEVRLLRPELISLVANQGEDAELIAEASRLARQWLDDRNAVQPDMVGVVLSTAAAHGDQALYERMLAELNRSSDAREHQELYGALGAFRSPAIVKSNFQLLLDGKADPREGIGMLFGPLYNYATRALPFELVRAHYDQLVARLPRAADSDTSAALPTLGAAFCDSSRRAEVASFFKERMARAVGGPRNLAHALETVDQCIAIRGAQEAGIAAFLKQQ
ncbi:MAG TPA: M1 family aminopeptidase [Bryobacteraceae bacterium]|nr:M1 family aminopeptidase [Bryobacteraceae bacterium]